MLNNEIIYDNENDVYLLMNKPNDLIIKYQYLVEFFVRKYISIGHIEAYKQDDFKQSVNEAILNKIPTIQKHYNKKTILRTYLSVVISNLCYDNVYKQKKSLVTITINDDNTSSEQEEILTGIIIDNEFDRIKKILRLYNKQQKTIEFILKVYFRFPITKEEFSDLSENLKIEDFEDTLNKINEKNTCTDTVLFEYLTPILNKINNKNNSNDAVRKWIKCKIAEIIQLVNGTPSRANYTNETLQILMEKYFAKTS